MTPKTLLGAIAAGALLLGSIALTAPAYASPSVGTITAHVVNTGSESLSQ